MKKRVLPFFLFSSCFLFSMLGCMATIPVKSGTTGLLIDRIEDMPKKVGLYCYVNLTPSINFKLNEELKADLIRLDFDVLGAQQMEALGNFDIVPRRGALRLKSGIAEWPEEDKKKLIEKLCVQALFVGFGDSGEWYTIKTIKEEIPYFSLGEIRRIKMELIDIKTGKIIWSVEAYDRGMDEKSAYLKAAKQVIKLFEEDIKAFDKELKRKEN